MRLFLLSMLTLFTIGANAMTVKSINYVGMVHISQNVALRMLEFEVGDNIDEKAVNKAVESYFKQGYFNDVWADYENGALTFNFTEKPIISKVLLKGWKENDEEEIKATVIQIKKGSLYNEQKLKAAKKRIIAAISQDGKLDSVVEVEKEVLENGSMIVTFIVNEGETIIIKNLEYNGVNGLDSDDFDDVIANKQEEFMGWLFGRNDGKMQLADLEYDNMRIRDYYMQYGYLDSKVSSPFVRVNFDSYTADMSYDVEEGSVYTISSVSVNQTTEVVDEQKIKDIITLENGEVFNIKDFRENAKDIKTLIADHSYAFAQVVPDLKKNKEEKTVDVIFKVIPGEKVRIRDVIISGNSRTLDRIVRRELYLGAGDLYSLTDLEDSRNSLGRLGYFENNAIEEKRIDNQTMDLVVKVKEAATGNIQVGGGYGSYGGLMVTLGVSDSNIWGSGIGMSVNIEKSQMSNNIGFSISNPRMNDSDFSGNFSVNKSSNDYTDYTVDSESLGIGTGYRFSRYITAYLGYNFSNNSYDVASTATSDYYRYFESYSKSSFTLSVKYDSTDDYYLPRKGMTITQSLEKAGVGGDAKFLKSGTSFAKYYGLESLIGFDAIARYKAKYNHILNDGYVPINEKLYIGGIGSVRGYESYSIAPIQVDNGYDRRIGGKMSFSNSAELSFPLIPKAKMRLVTYVDWGMIGEDSLSEFSRGGYGAGLEWFSPVGPVQLMFSQPLNSETYDRTSNFEFTMGQRF